jgi:hypothetical protein
MGRGGEEGEVIGGIERAGGRKGTYRLCRGVWGRKEGGRSGRKWWKECIFGEGWVWMDGGGWRMEDGYGWVIAVDGWMCDDPSPRAHTYRTD